jgi:hypothetical protein
MEELVYQQQLATWEALFRCILYIAPRLVPEYVSRLREVVLYVYCKFSNENLCNYVSFISVTWHSGDDTYVTRRNLVYVYMTLLIGIDLRGKNLSLKLQVVNHFVCKTARQISKKFVFGYYTKRFWSNLISLVLIHLKASPVLHELLSNTYILSSV